MRTQTQTNRHCTTVQSQYREKVRRVSKKYDTYWSPAVDTTYVPTQKSFKLHYQVVSPTKYLQPLPKRILHSAIQRFFFQFPLLSRFLSVIQQLLTSYSSSSLLFNFSFSDVFYRAISTQDMINPVSLLSFCCTQDIPLIFDCIQYFIFIRPLLLNQKLSVYVPGNYTVLAFLVAVIYYRRQQSSFRSSDMADVDRRCKMLHRQTICKLTREIN